MRKLGRLPEPPMLRIKHAERRILNRIDNARRNPPALPGKRLRLRNRTLDHLRLLDHVAMFFFVGVGNAQQHALETRTPVTIVRRKIRPTVKRLAIRSEKRSERPSALPADRAHRSLVPAVNIRTLVAIHFHRNEIVIHNRGYFGIVIRLAVHHMAPVAPYRANVEQHRLVLPPRRRKRLLAPLMPLNRLMHGRSQVSGRSSGEGVEGRGGHRSSLYATSSPSSCEPSGLPNRLSFRTGRQAR